MKNTFQYLILIFTFLLLMTSVSAIVGKIISGMGLELDTPSPALSTAKNIGMSGVSDQVRLQTALEKLGTLDTNFVIHLEKLAMIAEKDPAGFKAQATIAADSIDTKIAKRDEHLRSADFFNVAKYPMINFVSKSLSGTNGIYSLKGDLTIHNVTKEVIFPVQISGPIDGQAGDKVIGLTGELTINRQDFGITWNKVLDNGGVLIANNVQISIDLEAEKK